MLEKHAQFGKPIWLTEFNHTPSVKADQRQLDGRLVDGGASAAEEECRNGLVSEIVLRLQKVPPTLPMEILGPKMKARGATPAAPLVVIACSSQPCKLMAACVA